MPILWRYLLRNYFQVFFLCVSGFISVLLVTRFQEIAKFASLCEEKSAIPLFIFYQIPYILPIAIPISCVLASILLIQKMSITHEMTALRASGLSLQRIYSPLILASFFLGLLNLHVTSELAPECRRLSRTLIYEMTAVNPLFLLQKDSLIKIKHTFIDMQDFQSGEYAKDLIFAIHNQSNDRINLMIAEKMSLEKGMLLGKNVTFLSSLDSKNPSNYDHIIIENQKFMTTQDSTLAGFIQTTSQPLGYEHLPFRLMVAKKEHEKPYSRSTKKRFNAEITRRASLTLAPFTFTVIGLAFGMEIGRKRSKKGIITAILLSLFFLIAFVGAKSFKHAPFASMVLYFLPHPIILFIAMMTLKNTSLGKE